MTPEEYQRVQAVFLRVRDLPPDQRVSELHREDESVRREVESLLKSDSECGPFLERAVAEDLATTEHGEPTTSEAQVVGGYRLLQQIGEGGHGSVYMAEQLEPISRKVAVKLIKPGMDSKQILARFHAERQALAMMEHPSIARVIDAGTTEAGAPYFVMELVRGVPIDQFCTDNQLSLPERLTLFLQVCRAVHHAHQKGIIHRDLKPSNILVTMGEDEPIAKVIDFGIAKALDTRLTQQTLFTEYGQMIGTLEYMSPEQAEMSAIDIDTRSDIYSLGVLLYQLLTGETPISKDELLRKGLFEIPRLIRETEPATPSSRITARHQQVSRVDRDSPARGLPNLQRGDLDWIVMKAISKDRRRRYDSAMDFARDVQRFSEGKAVEAHPPSLAYKVTKLARRHRVAVIVTLLTMTSLLVGIVGLAVGLSRAIAAERSAKATGRELANTVYSDLVEAAWQAARQHNHEKAHRLLDSCLPELRGWEWRFVKTQLNATSHEVIRPGGGSPIGKLDIDPTEQTVAYVLESGRVEVRSLETQQVIRTVAEGLDVNAVRFAGRASLLVIGTTGGEVAAIDESSGQTRTTQLGLGGIYHISASPDGHQIAACTGGGWIVVLNSGTLEVIDRWNLPVRASSVEFIDEKTLAAGGLDGRAFLVELGQSGWKTAKTSATTLTRIAPIDAQQIVALSPSGAIGLEIEDDRLAPIDLLRSESIASALAVDPESGTLFVGCGDGSLLRLDGDRESEIANFGTAITSLRMGRSHRELLVALSDGRLLQIETRSSQNKWETQSPENVTTGRVLPKWGLAVVADDNGYLTAIEIESGETRWQEKAHDTTVWSVSADAGETLFASVGEDQMLRCWELPDFQLRFEKAIDWGVRDVFIAPDASWIAAAPPRGKRLGDQEGMIGLWDARSGDSLRMLVGHQNWVLQFGASADGSKLISTCENRETRVWDVETGVADVAILPGEKPSAEHVAVDDATGRVFLGHRDGWVTAWDLSEGTSRGSWPAFGDAISGLAVTEDGRVIATSRSDPRLKIQSTSLDRTLGQFDLGLGYVLQSRLGSNDRFLSLAGQSRRVLILRSERATE